MEDNLQYVLNPRSVAFIGASRNKKSFSYPILEIAKKFGYQGDIYLVNPFADSVFGMKCYPSITDIPAEIDVAVVMVSRKAAASAIEDCVEKGVHGLVIITAGYAEFGEEGRQLQADFAAKAASKGIRIIGPNTLGYFSAPVRLDVLMSGFFKTGRTALITQSGNITRSFAFPGAQRGLGFNYVIDLGNQAGLQFHELIRYFREDSGTDSIAVHIEGFRDGRKFLEEVRDAVKVKPVVVFKSGRTEVGARVVASHTAAIAGNDDICTAALRQCGALQVESTTEFNSLLLALGQKKSMAGGRVCIISEGGGDCVVATDACERMNLTVPVLSEQIQKKLREFVPSNGSVMNPIDLAGWEFVVQASEMVLEDENIDAVLVVGGFAGYCNLNPEEQEREQRYAEMMCGLIARSDKPILIYSYYSLKDNPSFQILRDHQVPLFMDHHDAVRTLSHMLQYQRYRKVMEGRSFKADFPAAAKPLSSPVLEHQAYGLLASCGIMVPEYRKVLTADESVQAAEDIGYPVAMKVLSKDILHKSDARCVQLNLSDSHEVKRAFDEISANARSYQKDADIAGMLVTKMDCEQGVEVIIGGVQDPSFGPVIMFGLGGVFVEVLKDVSFRVCPIDEVDAQEMITEISGYPMLAGARGTVPMDVSALTDALMRVSALLLEHPEIKEIDLNPVKVHAKGLSVLDARIIL